MQYAIPTLPAVPVRQRPPPAMPARGWHTKQTPYADCGSSTINNVSSAVDWIAGGFFLLAPSAPQAWWAAAVGGNDEKW